MNDIKKICRVCMVDEYNGNLTSVFENQPQNKTATDIFLITGVQLSSFPSCPAFICSKCNEELLKAIDFRNRCKSTDKFLRETVGNQEQSNWSDESDEIIPYDVSFNSHAGKCKEPEKSVFLEYAETILLSDDEVTDKWKLDERLSNEKHGAVKSSVWKYAQKRRNPLTREIEGVCFECGKVLKCSGGSTTSLKTHLKSKHDIDLTQKVESSTSRPSDAKKPKLTVKKKSLNEIICDMVTDGISIRAITRNSYIHSSMKRDGYDAPPNESSMMELVHQEFLDKKVLLEKEVKDFVDKGNKMSITLQNYKTNQNKNFVSINLHNYDNQKTYKLGLTRLIDQDPTKTIFDHLRSFGINIRRDILGTTQNGTEFVLKSTDVVHQMCINYGIQLGVCDTLYKINSKEKSTDEHVNDYSKDEFSEAPDFQIFNDSDDNQIQFHKLLNDIIMIVKVIHSSPETYKNFQSKAVEEFGKEVNLSLNIKHRWDTIPKMIDSIIKSKSLLVESFAELKSINFEALLELQKSIEPIKLAVETLNREDATLSMAQIVIEFMYNKLHLLNYDISTQLLSNIRRRLYERLNYDVINLLKCLKDTSVFPSKDTINFASNLALRLFDFGINNDQPNAMSEDSQPADNLSLQDELNLLLEKEKRSQLLMSYSTDSKKSMEQEFVIYRNTGIRTDVLQKLFIAIASLKPTSTDIKQVFSASTSFSTKINSGLSDESLKALIFLKFNYKK